MSGTSITRRKIAKVGAAVAGAFALGISHDRSFAQEFPRGPITVYLGFPAGTYLDIVTRYYTDRIAAKAGQAVVVENRVGAGGMLAMGAAAKARPDGQSLVFGPGLSASKVQFKSLPFDPVNDFIRIGTIVAFPFVLVVNPEKTDVKSVAELTAFLKQKGKQASFGSPNTLSLVAGALYTTGVGLEPVSVPYRSAADAIRDLTAGEFPFMFSDSGFAFSQMKTGKLRGLAVTLPKRTPNAPELPTMIESGLPNFDFHGWMGVYAPAGTPKPVIDKLSGWVDEVARAEETAKFLSTLGADPFPLNSEQFTKFEADEFKAWEERAKIAKIEPQ